MALLFNDLLAESGLEPADVRLLRHHTQPGQGGISLHDLWAKDREAFELYQSTQSPEKALFRSGPVWASFVSPGQGRTIFAGLYDARFLGKRAVDWNCPYRGGSPGSGLPVDVFETRLRDELNDQIGHLEIEWDSSNTRTWARYAEDAPFPVVASTAAPKHSSPLTSQLVKALESVGFSVRHRTSKVVGLGRSGLTVYVKAQAQRQPLVLHPHFFDLADQLEAIAGVSFERPLKPYVNSNMRGLPPYSAEHRETGSRFGFAVAAEPSSIPALVNLLLGRLSVETEQGPLRLLEDENEPLTERERLAAARIGQGEFRFGLLGLWQATCPLTGIDHPRLLRASHIKPWRSSSGRERLDPYNGLLLSAHADALFDAGLITFDDAGSLLVSSALGGNLERMAISASSKIVGLTDRHAPYLAYHRKHIFLS